MPWWFVLALVLFVGGFLAVLGYLSYVDRQVVKVWRAVVRFWATTQLLPKNRPSPVLRAAEEAKTAIENYRHTKRVRNREDADRWYAEYKQLGGIPEPMLVEAKPKKGDRRQVVLHPGSGGIHIIDADGNLVGTI